MDQITNILSKVLAQEQVVGIMVLIAFDITTGVASALKRKKFEWRRLFDFYATNFAPYLLVYLVAHTIGALVQVNADTLGPMATTVSYILTNSWVVVVGKIGISILANCQELGIKLPEGT